VVLQIGWKTTKIGETHQSAINQRWCEAIKWSGVGCNFGIQKNIVWRKFHGVWIRCHGGYFKQHLFKHLSSWFLRISSKLKIIPRLVDKSNSLKIEYWTNLTKVVFS
jgi:hypothetical protein